jgi:hypothetical protein
MKKTIANHKLEKGQVIPLVVVMLFAIIGMTALILDGGSVLSNRRTAQAAADAGALAGAKRACSGHSDGIVVGEAYALNNGATTANATVSGTEVTVQTTVENPSFFAKIFGVETLQASAEATAGCYGVSGKSVVPLTWYCRARSVGGPYPEEYGCQIQTLSWDLMEPILAGDATSVVISDYDGIERTYLKKGFNILDSEDRPPEQIYIIADSDKVCVEDGGDLLCDLDGDGKKDIQLGGDRGWIYLTADTSNIGNWVDQGPHPDITLKSHIWLSGKSGVATSVYIKMVSSGFVGEVVLVPVFNYVCDGDPRVDTSCVAEAHASPPWPPFSGEDDFSQIKFGSDNYHIIAFEPFYITCIDKKGDCPGAELAGIDGDGPVVEGFFLSDYPVSPDSGQGCDINLGNCTISLSN